MRKIFSNDFPGVEDDSLGLSREAQKANEQLESSVKWNAEKGKYSAGLPYKLGRERTAEILRGVNSRTNERKNKINNERREKEREKERKKERTKEERKNER